MATRRKIPHEVQWKSRGCECDVDTACAFMRERDESRTEVARLKGIIRAMEERQGKELSKAYQGREDLRQEFVKLKRTKRMMLHLGGPDRYGMFWIHAIGKGHKGASLPIPRDSKVARIFAEALGQDREIDWKTLRRKAP